MCLYHSLRESTSREENEALSPSSKREEGDEGDDYITSSELHVFIIRRGERLVPVRAHFL